MSGEGGDARQPTSYAIGSERMPIPWKEKASWDGERRVRRLETPETYMTDPVSRSTQPFPFHHAHAPEKECDGGRTENRLIQIHLVTETEETKRRTGIGKNPGARAREKKNSDVLGRLPLWSEY